MNGFAARHDGDEGAGHDAPQDARGLSAVDDAATRLASRGAGAMAMAGVVHPDIQHVATWIASVRAVSAHTRRSYRREAMRFLAWLQHYRGKLTRLSQVSGADALAYRYFLQQPTDVPVSVCEHFGLSRSPWKAGLQDPSIAQAATILSGLYETLRRTPGEDGRAILELNPFFGGGRAFGESYSRPRERALTVEQWHAVLDTITAIEDPGHRARCRWIFLLSYYSFLRSHEMAKMRMGDFRRQNSGAWTIHVVGKGKKAADIAAPPVLMDELAAYRRSLGLAPFPVDGDPTPAIRPMRTFERRADVDHTLTPASIYLIFKAIFARAAERHPSHKDAFERASTHWMRHTGITHTLDSGRVDPRYVQKQARHANRQTTDRYDNRPIDAISEAFAVMGEPARRAPARFDGGGDQ